MIITHQTVLGEDGQPEAAIIPWNVFLQIKGLIGDEMPSKEEIAEYKARVARRQSGETQNVSREELHKQIQNVISSK